VKQDYEGKSDGSWLSSRQSHRKENNEMQNTDQQLKEKEERKNKLPQLKVRTDIRSGYCTWVDVPPLKYICT
jgi:hypothetical protein